MAEETTRRRRNPRNLGGRPRLEDIGEMTPEMEDVAQYARAGFSLAETAEQLSQPTERIQKILANPRVRARIRRLLGDYLTEVDDSRKRIWSVAVERMVALIKEGKVSEGKLDELIRRYDPFERLDDLLTKDQQKLLDQARKTRGRLLGSGDDQDEDRQEKQQNIFKPLESGG